MAPRVSKARRSSLTAVGTSSKLSAEMAHLACFWASDMAWSSATKLSETWSGTWLNPPGAAGATCELAGCVGGGMTGLETLAAGGGALPKFWVEGGGTGGPGTGE